MIQFFRNVRKKLLAESKTRKYISYAFGEIILVMIGILLALQVNEWNNGRLDIKKEQIILENLKVDFENNIHNLDETYASFMEAYNASVNLLEIIKDDSEIDSREVEHLMDLIINKTKSYDLITGSINEIFNTGSLHLLRDPVLRKEISNWSFYFTDTEDDMVIYKDNLFELFIPFLMDKVKLRNMDTPSFFEKDIEFQSISKSSYDLDYKKTIRNVEFENQVYNNTLNYMYVINSYKFFRNYLASTLILIESNIK